MWTSRIPACSSRALFFHSESLLRHTLEEVGYNEKKEKERKKKKTRVAMTQRSLSPSQQGWPPRHHGKGSPEPAAAWPLQHSHEKEQHFLTESPISDLLSWVQSGLSNFSYHKEISLPCARHFGRCTVFAQGSVKKYFTRRITLELDLVWEFSK